MVTGWLEIFWLWQPFFSFLSWMSQEDGAIQCQTQAGCTEHQLDMWNVFINEAQFYFNLKLSFFSEFK